MDNILFRVFISAIQIYSKKMSGGSVEDMFLENYRMLTYNRYNRQAFWERMR
jgi:hypothetical protein